MPNLTKDKTLAAIDAEDFDDLPDRSRGKNRGGTRKSLAAIVEKLKTSGEHAHQKIVDRNEAQTLANTAKREARGNNRAQAAAGGYTV
jgi:hypothetical protein